MLPTGDTESYLLTGGQLQQSGFLFHTGSKVYDRDGDRNTTGFRKADLDRSARGKQLAADWAYFSIIAGVIAILTDERYSRMPLCGLDMGSPRRGLEGSSRWAKFITSGR
jgi:hypothetical protein